MSKIKIGCIADDFTGGSDAASFLKKGGLQTLLINGDAYTGYIPDAETQAIVIALKTRSTAPADAVEQSLAAVRWLLRLGTQQIYFKYCSTFDSTERGNIGPVTDSLMEEMQVPFTVLCPALPVNGRTVTDGILYVNGVPLSESPMRHHPLNPMRESRVEDLMGRQSRYPCTTLDHSLLAQPFAQIKQLMAETAGTAGHATAVLDYDAAEQGAALAELFGELPLLTGGSGLLEHLARQVTGASGQQPAKTHTGSTSPARRLILAGSCSSMTQRQVLEYVNSGKRSVRLEPEKLFSGEQSLSGLKAVIQSEEDDLLIYSTAAPDELSRSSEGHDVSALLEYIMGELAACGEDLGIRNIIVAGGETSGAVIRRLGHALFFIGEDAAPGVPIMCPADRPDIRLVLKSGNFGDESFFLKTLT